MGPITSVAKAIPDVGVTSPDLVESARNGSQMDASPNAPMATRKIPLSPRPERNAAVAMIAQSNASDSSRAMRNNVGRGDCGTVPMFNVAGVVKVD